MAGVTDPRHQRVDSAAGPPFEAVNLESRPATGF